MPELGLSLTASGGYELEAGRVTSVGTGGAEVVDRVTTASAV